MIIMLGLFLLLVYKKIMSWKKKVEFKNLDIIMYGYDNCPFTVKMKNELKNNKVFHHIRYIDILTDQDGKNEFEEKNFEGVPVLYSNITKKSSIGYFPYSEIFKKIV